MIFVEIAESADQMLRTSLFEDAAQATLKRASPSSEVSLTILLTGDEQVRDLNRQYLGIDEPTDVLSFPADYTDPDTNVPYLGDVIISCSQAQVQAANGGHSLEEEMQLLVVHGVLHLLGYDHMFADEKERMWSIQSEILRSVGCSIDPPSG